MLQLYVCIMYSQNFTKGNKRGETMSIKGAFCLIALDISVGAKEWQLQREVSPRRRKSETIDLKKRFTNR